jgi:hypothetical protein
MESVVERAKAWLKMCDDVDAGRAYSCDIIRELLAVVEMYPKTVDGAPVWPGMVVYDKRARRGSEQVSSASSPVPVTPGDAAAPAVDPRRLTDGELWEAYLSAWRSNMTPNNVPPELGEQGVKRLRAVANAQLAKAAADNAAWSVGVEDELT